MSQCHKWHNRKKAAPMQRAKNSTTQKRSFESLKSCPFWHFLESNSKKWKMAGVATPADMDY